MKRQVQVDIMKELLRQLDVGKSVDAGVMYRNPVSAYTSSEIADREWETFFQNHPQLIALSGSLPGPGSYLTIDDFGLPILATRDSDGRFHAFLNACRHRGSRIANQARGEGTAFECPFHNWTYSYRGELQGMPRRHDFGEIDRARHGLIELPAVERDGLLWVHPQVDGTIDPDALLGELAPEIASWGFGSDMIHMGESVIEGRLNWKLANDTFGEAYHVSRLHRDTVGHIYHGDVLAYEEFGRNHRFVLALKTIDSLRKKPEDEWNFLAATNPLYYLFPNIQLVLGAGAISLVKIYPRLADPSRSTTRVIHYFSSEMVERAEQDDAVLVTGENVYNASGSRPSSGVSVSALTEIFDSTIEKEDYVMGANQQRAAESGQLEYVLFGRNEPALHHYHNVFREGLGMPRMELVRTPDSSKLA